MRVSVIVVQKTDINSKGFGYIEENEEGYQLVLFPCADCATRFTEDYSLECDYFLSLFRKRFPNQLFRVITVDSYIFKEEEKNMYESHLTDDERNQFLGG